MANGKHQFKDPEKLKVDIEKIRGGRCPGGVDPTKKELYLTAEKFEYYFKETLEEFQKRSKKDQKDKKAKLGIV